MIIQLLVQSERMKKLEEDARGAKDIADKLQKKFDIMAAVQVRQTNDLIL